MTCRSTSFPLFSSVQFSLLVMSYSFVTPWTTARQASLSIINSWSLLKFMSIESVMPSNHLILCHPLLLLLSIFPSIRVFSNESVLHITWPKYWSFSFSISPSNEYSGLISFRMDWLNLLAVQGTLKSLYQHHSSKASILFYPFYPSHILWSRKAKGDLLLFSRPVISDSLQPRGLQPIRLIFPWDFPGKSTGVGCHCLLREGGSVSCKNNLGLCIRP